MTPEERFNSLKGILENALKKVEIQLAKTKKVCEIAQEELSRPLTKDEKVELDAIERGDLKL